MVNKKDKLYWAASVDETFNAREIVPDNEKARQIPEQFLATAIKYLRALCKDIPDKTSNQ